MPLDDMGKATGLVSSSETYQPQILQPFLEPPTHSGRSNYRIYKYREVPYQSTILCCSSHVPPQVAICSSRIKGVELALAVQNSLWLCGIWAVSAWGI